MKTGRVALARVVLCAHRAGYPRFDAVSSWLLGMMTSPREGRQGSHAFPIGRRCSKRQKSQKPTSHVTRSDRILPKIYYLGIYSVKEQASTLSGLQVN